MSNTPNKADQLRTELVERIITQIQENPGTWTQSWTPQLQAGVPFNATSGRHYRGGNVLWLLFTAIDHGYATNGWATYKQWGENGAQVRKGEKATTVLLWKRTERKVTNPDTGEVEKKQSMFATTYNVFNAAQVDVVDEAAFAKVAKRLEGVEAPEFTLAHAEEFFAPIPARIVVGDPAYSPEADVVFMPGIADFNTPEQFYATKGHELVHWTGHKSRLNRISYGSWGDDSYAFEELVAELGSAMIAAQLGIDHVTTEGHVAYLAHWVARLRENPQSLWTAATKASDAVDMLESFASEAVAA